MSELKFRRNTHDENGHHKPFSRAALVFWHTAGYGVGDVLRLEQALTLDEIFTVYAEYLAETEPGAPAEPEHVLWCLAQLVRYGLAEIVFEPLPAHALSLDTQHTRPERFQLPLELPFGESALA